MPYVTSWERMAKDEGVKIGEEIGEERGVKIGEERGVTKEKIETTRRLIKRGVDIDIIVDATGLSREEIEKLAETVN